MHRTLSFLTSALLSGLTLTASAQGTCSRTVVDALNAVNANCAGQANNSACYGNFHLESQPAVGAAATFANPADRTPLETLASITSIPFNAATQEWGVAVLKVQGSGPGVLPGQAVTMLLVGDATLNGVGTQAYTIRAGLGVPSCEGVPPSSLLVQGPRSVAIDLSVNGASIRLGSTMVISAQQEGQLTFATLDGRADIDGTLLPVGYTTRADIDEDGQIVGDSFSTPAIMSEDEALLYAGYDEFPEAVLEYTIDTPDEAELALIDALGYELALEIDGHTLRDLVDFMIEVGYTPADFEGLAPEDIAAFLTSDEFAETLPADLFSAFLDSYNDPSDEPTLDDFDAGIDDAAAMPEGVTDDTATDDSPADADDAPADDAPADGG